MATESAGVLSCSPVLGGVLPNIYFFILFFLPSLLFELFSPSDCSTTLCVFSLASYILLSTTVNTPSFYRVSRSWGSTVDMRAQRLRDLGFLVLKCDNRGSFRR